MFSGGIEIEPWYEMGSYKLTFAQIEGQQF